MISHAIGRRERDTKEGTVKTITMTEFREQPGEYLIDVRRNGDSFLLTKNGTPVAKLMPIDDVTVIRGDGSVVGERPLTWRRDLAWLR
jgi:prevent-host-death family protein